MRRWILLLILLVPLLLAGKPENPGPPPTIPVPPHVELPPQAPTEPGNPSTKPQPTEVKKKEDKDNSPWGDIYIFIGITFEF